MKPSHDYLIPYMNICSLYSITIRIKQEVHDPGTVGSKGPNTVDEQENLDSPRYFPFAFAFI